MSYIERSVEPITDDNSSLTTPPSDAMLPTYPQDTEQPAMPSDPLLESATQHPVSDVFFQNCLPQLFSYHEHARTPLPQLSLSDIPTSQYLAGASATLLTNPFLSDYLSSYPIWPHQADSPETSLSRPSSPSLDDAYLSRQLLLSKVGAGGIQREFLVRGKHRPRKWLRQQRQKLRQGPRTDINWDKRQRQYKCGTCALRDYVCHWSPGSPPEGRKGEDPICRTIVRAEKTVAAVEWTDNYSAEVFLQKIALPSVAMAPCLRFKEWTSDGKDLQLTQATVIPPVRPNIVFGSFDSEQGSVQMANCITADLLLDR